MQINYEKEAAILKALANPVRLKIIDAIRGGKICVKTLEDITGASQSSVSQHLTILRNLGMVETTREGNLVCYSLNHALANKVLDCIYDEYNNHSTTDYE